MSKRRSTPRGRGTGDNPPNRFDGRSLERVDDWESDVDEAPATTFLPDATRSILSWNSSPDIGFDVSINPYRGCEHGCAYCYARPFHEYLGLSAGLDFETTILVKHDASILLRSELSARSWSPRVIELSGVTDPYQPVERRLRLTRACLDVLAEFRNPCSIITKNALVARDIDVLARMAEEELVSVVFSITTLRDDLARELEPRTSMPRRKLQAMAALRGAGIPVGVMVAPVIPGLTDAEIPSILRAAADAGAGFASWTLLRLPHGVADLFDAWLERCMPERRSKVLSRLRDMRGGDLNDPRFGMRMRGSGVYYEQLSTLFRAASERVGLTGDAPQLRTDRFRRRAAAQTDLFDDDMPVHPS